MTASAGDLQDFKVMYLDFATSNLEHICWIVRTPSEDEPDLCRVGSFEVQHFLRAIVASPDTYTVTHRFRLGDIIGDLSTMSATTYLLVPLRSAIDGEMYVFDDFDSKVTLHALYNACPSLHICVLEQLASTAVQDYDRAMKVVA